MSLPEARAAGAADSPKGTSTEGAAVVVATPFGFSPGDLARPDFSQSPRIALEQWQSARDASGHEALVWACTAGDASSWSADASELAQGKLAEIASGTAARMRGEAVPMHVEKSAPDLRERSLRADHPPDAWARTFVVFTPGRAHGCFVTCTSPGCESAVSGARVSGELVSPPPPGLALRALGLAVHHPHGALAVLGAILALAAALAIGTRPGRPRKRRVNSPFRA